MFYAQIFDVAHLLLGRFIWNRSAPGFDNGIIQTLVTGVSVVVLLAAVVGVDYNIV